jgi:DNA repair exonuclease SbcCD nuclease subunit
MNILLTSDIHLGVKQNSEFFIYNTREFFLKQVAEQIEKNDVKEFWILGDLYDCRNNTNTLVNNVAMSIMAKLLSSFPDLKINIITGNHDIYYKNTLDVSSLKVFIRFHERLKIYNTIEEVNVGGLRTLIVPWIIKGNKMYDKFMAIVHNLELGEIPKYDLCLGHFEINGFEVVNGVVAKSEFTTDLFKGFDKVFSGHFHLRREKENIQYLGCPYELTWNDYGDAKGLTLYNTDTRQATFVPNTVSPRHKKVILSSIKKDESLLDEVTKNFIKFIVDVNVSTEEINEWFKKIEDKKPIKYEVLYEVDLSNEESNEVVIDTDIQKDAVLFVYDYIDQDPLPSNIDKDEFKLYIKKLYDEASSESD